MEEIKLIPEALSYTYEKWLAGHPEPEFKNWGLISEDGLGKNMEYSQIQKAKNYTFYTALEFTLITMKKVYTEKLLSIIPERREMYRAELLKEAEGKYSGYGTKELIDRWHKNKFEKIDGLKYKQVKEQQERLEKGETTYPATLINDFHTAVLNFELAESLRGNESKPEVVVERGESFAVRYELIKLLFDDKPEFREMTEDKRADLFKYVLGIIGTHGKRTARGIKSKNSKYWNPSHEKRAKDLLDKIKKGTVM